MAVVSNHRHNSSPTADWSRDSGAVGSHGMCGGMVLSLLLQVTLAKSLSLPGLVYQLAKEKGRKGSSGARIFSISEKFLGVHA